MRAYHFTSAKHALDNLRHRRLKIATFRDLNDPFELWSVAQPNTELRQATRGWKRDITNAYGVLCFSKNWHNPLLWSHYGDRHRGIALGFDIHPTIIKDVRYVRRRPTFSKPDIPTLHLLLYTKHEDWRYEQECRIFTRLDDQDPTTRLYFGKFNRKLVLQEVITGALCTTAKEEIAQALRGKNVAITKGRLAFNTFNIVKDQRGFRNQG
jgi:hypothetical protein